MNRGLIFDSPFLLGFEHTRNLIERAAKAAAESYPPYNVEDLGEGSLRITLAVAGFSPDQRSDVGDRQLVVAADVTPATAKSEHLHRGIAARSSKPSGRRHGGGGRDLEHGLLHIDWLGRAKKSGVEHPDRTPAKPEYFC